MILLIVDLGEGQFINTQSFGRTYYGNPELLGALDTELSLILSSFRCLYYVTSSGKLLLVTALSRSRSRGDSINHH